MKQINIIMALLVFIIIHSCGKTEYSDGIGEQATLFNESGVSIKYVPYYSGYPVHDYTFTMEDKDSFFLGNYHSMLSGNAPGFSSPYLTGYDSIQIVYNNNYISTHIWTYPESLLHQLNALNERNIGNPKNYVWWFDESLRRSIHEYTFTPSDYEYAKKCGLVIE